MTSQEINKECLDCTHSKQREDNGNYCYMFEKSPEHLPCGQHDKFAEARRLTGNLIRKNPAILAMMIREMGGYL